MFAPPKAEVEKEVRTHRSGWVDNLGQRFGQAVTMEFTMFFQFFFLDVLAMLILGMGLAKAQVFSATRSVRFYGTFASAGFALGIPLHYWAASGFDTSGFFNYIASTADGGRLAVALGYTGIVMLVCKAGAGLLTRPLAAVGRTELSNYLLTSILCTLFFNGYGLGNFGQLERHQLYYVVLAVWAVNLTVGPIWLRYFQYGPAEWAWRSLTYWERQSMRRAAIMESSS
ncbi:MAG: DUF418 domain-containing protein [Bryobacterales bacterium]|nr:DUF418 domain-containing protein [Bryobacterales bacterium]